MNNSTIQFLVFIIFSAICLALGYLARRRRWIPEAASRGIHLHTVAWTWTPVSLLSIWQIPIDGQFLVIIFLQPVIMIITWQAVVPIARRIGCNQRQTGVMALAAGLGNQGFTLGAYLCFTMLDPAQHALGYASAYVSSQALFTVLLFYPISQHYAGGKGQSMAKLIFTALLGLRAAPLYAAIAGVILSLIKIPYPKQIIEDYHIFIICFYLGAMGSYIGIGLRLRLGDSLRYLKHHIWLMLIKFTFIPTIIITLAWLINHYVQELSDLQLDVLAIESFMPVAIATVIVANIFDLDARLASVLWLWNTIAFCVIPLPIIFLIF